MLPRFIAIATFGVLAAVSASSQATTYPLTLENCGREVTFDAAPQRDVTVGQAATEILYALGFADRVVGTSVWFNPVLDEFEAVNEGIERLADNDPSFESVVAKRPDLVAIQYEWHVGPEGIVGTRDMFHDLGVATYVLPTDCVNKDNSVGVDGTRSAMFDTDALYRGIRELARVHDAPKAGEKLVDELRARETAAIEKSRSLDLGDVSAVFWFSSAEMDVDPYVAGRKGVPAYMMEQLGIRNVIESDEEWPTVGWETIAQANPDLIVIAEMDRRRFPADDVEKKLEFLRTDPVASQLDAVKHDRIVVMDAHAMDPSIRNVGALERLADELETLDLSDG